MQSYDSFTDDNHRGFSPMGRGDKPISFECNYEKYNQQCRKPNYFSEMTTFWWGFQQP